MIKIFKLNSLIFILLITICFFFLKLLNFYFGGTPRYYEILYNFEDGNLRGKKEKLIKYKSHKITDMPFLIKFHSQNYKSLGYSGKMINENCGSLEQGHTELIYQTDKFGFRENSDLLYKKTDIVLLGDSFTMGVCVNKPYDLKSNLQKKIPKKKILNLGKHGSDYPQQLSNLISYTKKTDFNTLVWFFYEGNDYETKITNKERENILNLKNENQKLKVSYANNYLENLNYSINSKYNYSIFYKFKVYLSELLSGFSTLITYWKNYPALLNQNDYNFALNIGNEYLKDKKVNKKFVFYIPSWQKISLYKIYNKKIFKNHPKLSQFKALKNNVKKIAEKNGFKFIDGDKYFMNRDKPLDVFYYRLNTHFNVQGYNVLADSILGYLN